MPTYTDEPAILGIVPLITQIADAYTDSSEPKSTPSDVAMKVLENLDRRALAHFFGELLIEETPGMMTGHLNHTAGEMASWYLRAYALPYVYEQPGVAEAMRERGHAGQLPRSRTN